MTPSKMSSAEKVLQRYITPGRMPRIFVSLARLTTANGVNGFGGIVRVS